MPLEIKELYIKVTVNQPQSEEQASSAGERHAAGDDKELVIQQCMEQVIEFINAKKER